MARIDWLGDEDDYEMGTEEEHYVDLAREQVESWASSNSFSDGEDFEVILASSSLTKDWWVGYLKTEPNDSNNALYEVVVNRQTQAMAVGFFQRSATRLLKR